MLVFFQSFTGASSGRASRAAPPDGSILVKEDEVSVDADQQHDAGYIVPSNHVLDFKIVNKISE